jgi:NADH-quinone oxidoreductase subunit F
MASPQLDGILEKYRNGGRPVLLPALIDAQAAAGYLSAEVLTTVSRRLGVPLSHAYGVASFYSLLYTEPVGRRIIRVCDSAPCLLAGAHAIAQVFTRQLGIRRGETTPDGESTLELVPCLGACDRAPVMLLDERLHTHLTTDGAVAGLRGELREVPTQHLGVANGTEPVLLKHHNVTDYHRLERYVELGGYQGLRKALTEMTPAQVIAEVKASGLMGRGGAAFPTGPKWEFCAREVSVPKYVVCNADESEPGTFKDRWLLLHDPFSTIEGMTLAAFAVAASQGYIYIRGEYPEAAQRFQQALNEARAGGYLGHDILGSGLSFDIELRRGAGAYICGEETALFESIEGERGMPRVKPPFPTTYGLFGQPTVINNVETLSNVPGIVVNGSAWFRRQGTEKSPGTRLFCLSGHVERPGIYEVPLGYKLRDLIYELGGGIKNEGRLGAVVCGGAAGTFLRPETIDVALDFQAIAQVGGTLGSGAIMVFDDTVNLWEIALNFAQFFKHESCGKCYPCQIGTQRQMEILERVVNGVGAQEDDAGLLRDLGVVMTDASICGLGQTAASATISLLEHWGLPE